MIISYSDGVMVYHNGTLPSDKLFSVRERNIVYIYVGVVLRRLLPNPMVDETTAVCLFVGDVDRGDRDYSITVDKYREMIDQLAIKPHIDVIDSSHSEILSSIK